VNRAPDFGKFSKFSKIVMFSPGGILMWVPGRDEKHAQKTQKTAVTQRERTRSGPCGRNKDTHHPHTTRRKDAPRRRHHAGNRHLEVGKIDPRKTLQNLLTKASKRGTPIEKKKEKKKSKRRKRKEKEDKKRGGSMAL